MKRAAQWSFDAARAMTEITKTYGVKRADIIGRSRRAHIVKARYALFSIMRRLGMSYPQIGGLCGFDHTTVIYGVARHRGRVAESEEVAFWDRVLT